MISARQLRRQRFGLRLCTSNIYRGVVPSGKHPAHCLDRLIGGVASRSDRGVTLTAGGGSIGHCAAASQSTRRVHSGSTRGRLVTLEISGTDALVAGIPDGGSATIAIAPASVLPEGLWPALLERKPVMLSAEIVMDLSCVTFGAIDDSLDGTGTRSRRMIDSACFVPVQRLAVFGNGPVVNALTTYATALGWQVAAAGDPERY